MTILTRELRRPRDFSPFPAENLDQSLALLFERMVERYPEQVAVKDPQQGLTYRALNAASNRLAQIILENFGVGDAAPIGFLLGHDQSSVIALLAILKAGRPYVALHASDTVERLKGMASDAQIACLVSSSPYRPLVQELLSGLGGAPALYLEELDLAVAAPNPQIYVLPDFPFSIVYTSGSTGEPKGMVLSHQYVTASALQATNQCLLSASDRSSLLSSFSFGAAYANVMGALLNGGTVCLYDFRTLGPQRALEWILSEQISVLRVTPSVFRAIFERAPVGMIFPSIRIIELGGEPARGSDVTLFKAHTAEYCTLINVFASTEACRIATFPVGHEAPVSDDFLPAGHPEPDKEIMLLDDDGRPVKPGEAGEIVVRGAYLASGYWRKPELSAAKFQPDPEQAGMQIFYSGDLGRWRADGVLEFLGRKDSMVKIRGYRVELSEIEARLQEHALVKEAAVIARPGKSRPDQLQLIAYVVLRPGSRAEVSAWREHLRTRLPDYMVPSFFVFLDQLPLNVNGKVDRRALPDPSERAELSAADLPSDATEEELVEIWSSLLKVDRVGVHDNFFELGGDSLSVLSMMLDVEKVLGKPVPKAFFRAPTIRGLAALLQDPEQLPAEEDQLFRLEAHGRSAAAKVWMMPQRLRRSLYRATRNLKEFRRTHDEAYAFEWALARFALRMSFERAMQLVSRLAGQTYLLNSIYLRKLRLFGRFLASLGLAPADPHELFRTNFTSNLALKLIDARPPFRDKGRSALSRDRSRLIGDTPLDRLDKQFPVAGLKNLEVAHAGGHGVILLSFHGTALGAAALRVLSRRLGVPPIQTVAYGVPLQQSYLWGPGMGSSMPSAVAGSLYAEIAYHGHSLLRQGLIIHVSADVAHGPGRRIPIQIGDRVYALRPGFPELALNTGSKVIPVFGRFIEGSRLLVEILPPLDPGRGGRDEQIEALMRQYAEFMNAVFKSYPQIITWKKMRNHLKMPRAKTAG